MTIAELKPNKILGARIFPEPLKITAPIPEGDATRQLGRLNLAFDH